MSMWRWPQNSAASAHANGGSGNKNEVTAVVRPFIKNVAGLWWRIESPITPGFPDLVGAYSGRTAFVECKIASKLTNIRISHEQREMLGILPQAWLFVLVIDSGCYHLISGCTIPEIPRGQWNVRESVPFHGATWEEWDNISRILWFADID